MTYSRVVARFCDCLRLFRVCFCVCSCVCFCVRVGFSVCGFACACVVPRILLWLHTWEAAFCFVQERASHDDALTAHDNTKRYTHTTNPRRIFIQQTPAGTDYRQKIEPKATIPTREKRNTPEKADNKNIQRKKDRKNERNKGMHLFGRQRSTAASNWR